VHVGDRLKIGSAELAVTQPRLPCYKLGIRFGRADMVKPDRLREVIAIPALSDAWRTELQSRYDNHR
jgi:hypothetical protein